MRRLVSFFSLPMAPIILAPFILLSPLLLGGKAMFWGTPALQFVPWWHYAWETLRSGHLPLWNPLVGMGAPLVANYQSALFYPPNWLYFLLAALGGLPALAWGQALLVALHLAWAGAGMALLARRLGLGVVAQAVSGLAFGLSGYLVARSGFLSINAAAAWLPWVLLAGLGLVSAPQTTAGPPEIRAIRNVRSPYTTHTGRRGWLRPILRAALALAMLLLAGHAQTAWYILILAGLWVGFWAWQKRPQQTRSIEEGEGAEPQEALVAPLPALLRAEARLALAGLLAVLLAAVQLLPTAEYLVQSQRAGAVDYELAMTYSFWPWRLLTALAPDLFGSPVQGNYWGYGNYWEDAFYIGVLPLLLALSALLGARRKTSQAGLRPLALRFLFPLLGVAFLLALGRNTPVFVWLYFHVPTFDMFQAPARYLIWVVFALALLAGIGVESWRRPEKRRLYWTRLGAAAGVAVAIGAGIGWYVLRDANPSFFRATALAGVWALGTALLSLVAPPASQGEPARRRRLWGWSVALFVAADLLVAGWGLLPGIDADFYRRLAPTNAQVQEIRSGRRHFLPAADEEVLKFRRFVRFRTFAPRTRWEDLRAALLPNLNMLDGLPSANNFDPLVPGRYARWMAALETASQPTRQQMLDLMDVGVIERIGRGQPYGVRFQRNPGTVESTRLRFTPCALAAGDDDHAWSLVTGGEVNFTSTVVLENLPSTDNQCDPSATGSARLLAETPARLQIQVQAPSEGWLAVSDVWYPGWEARVDGQAAPVLRANYLFRGVAIPAGTHEVILEYHPRSFTAGAVLSALGLLALLGAWIAPRWLRRLRRQTLFADAS